MNSAEPIVGESRLPALLRLQAWQREWYDIAMQAVPQPSFSRAVSSAKLRASSGETLHSDISCFIQASGSWGSAPTSGTGMPWVAMTCVCHRVCFVEAGLRYAGRYACPGVRGWYFVCVQTLVRPLHPKKMSKKNCRFFIMLIYTSVLHR